MLKLQRSWARWHLKPCAGLVQVDITGLSIPGFFTADNSSNGNAVYAANALFRVTLYSDSYAASLAQTTARRRLMADASPSALRALAGPRRPQAASLGTAVTTAAGWPAQRAWRAPTTAVAAGQLSHTRWRRRSLLAASSAFQDLLQTKLQLVADAFDGIVHCNKSAMMDNFFASGDLPQNLSSNCSTSITEAATDPSTRLDTYLKEVSSRGSLTATKAPCPAQQLPISNAAQTCSHSALHASVLQHILQQQCSALQPPPAWSTSPSSYLTASVLPGDLFLWGAPHSDSKAWGSAHHHPTHPSPGLHCCA